MLKEERQSHILIRLEKAHRATFEELAGELQVSEDTVRRDIDALAKNGLLTKVRGGAIVRSLNPFTFQDREKVYPEGKLIIAQKAQRLIKEGQTIFMDGGTTLCAVALHFPRDLSFRVVTNNQALIGILKGFEKIEVMVLGGILNRATETTVGAFTCREVKNYLADLYFMGTCAVDSKYGVTAAVREDGEVKQAMLEGSLKTVALAGQEKLGSTDHFRVCSLDGIDALITDLPNSDPLLKEYKGRDLEII
ncbi:DeoR/GlpR family DNA-binding transcription regulator [Rufibacter hautae]|uniref:DeoR/GlpR transcriptional regulator n=1 Tax=Rufibacter hautae TaxID=2595005 RepID=A0A5B6TRS7_9BACT|nr:DeoR/GlpR family DNA-binding transcription regulator [Rufibacter hautae]KAA3439228.1 DeoR/GlpR transcriptional regulator [Rufibacter hautae]